MDAGQDAPDVQDIASPRCFEIEERLQRDLDIPIFHDDQHGTAIVVLARTKGHGAGWLVINFGWGMAVSAFSKQQSALGSGRAELPGNDEVEDEVRSYLSLFCADTQPAELAANQPANHHAAGGSTRTAPA